VAALLGLGAALVLTGNGRSALADLVHGRIQRWSASMEERFEVIRAAQRQGLVDLVLPAAPEPPRIYARMDVSDDPSHWKNAGMARYFGLRSVAIPKRTAAAPLTRD
jgi:hypothetical protein